ncbi:DNA-directed RNA polymerase III subunit RPC6 [Phalaenopsis equestris]|uniref:DNA-directed RNA polymerase III subunit RPC6 n=1 Tax=Phalaenopsis equestris TaxID=78828 RepID=UPI0009E47AF8|nr:DNA-directed RNA polymerase III subunit RPC6 [Phalaenopsis equestris]
MFLDTVAIRAIRASWEGNDGIGAYRDHRNSHLSHLSAPLLPETVEEEIPGTIMNGTAKLPQKRKLPPLPENEKKLHDLIWSKQSLGIWTADMKKQTGLANNAVTKALKSLQSKNLIKDVVNVHNKARKFFMAVEFEPSKEISGGTWYSDGTLDLEFIRILREQCRMHVERLKIASVENVWKCVRDSGIFKTECSLQQIQEILVAMYLDKEIEELISSGVGEFSNIQAGKKCYRSLRGRGGPKAGGLSSVPCGVCPRINECSPDGIISPKTCVYYQKWLGLDF